MIGHSQADDGFVFLLRAIVGPQTLEIHQTPGTFQPVNPLQPVWDLRLGFGGTNLGPSHVDHVGLWKTKAILMTGPSVQSHDSGYESSFGGRLVNIIEVGISIHQPLFRGFPIKNQGHFGKQGTLPVTWNLTFRGGRRFSELGATFCREPHLRRASSTRDASSGGRRASRGGKGQGKRATVKGRKNRKEARREEEEEAEWAGNGKGMGREANGEGREKTEEASTNTGKHQHATSQRF